MLPRILGPIVGSVLLVALLLPSRVPPRAASSSPEPVLPSFAALLASADDTAWPDATVAGDELVHALVQLDLPPLAVLGLNAAAPARAAHRATLSAAQDRLAAQIAARGGLVQARFQQAAAALAVTIPAAQVAELRALPGVAAVQPIDDPTLTEAARSTGALTQERLAELINSSDVHRRGITGSGVAIAIVDSGVDYTHAKLGGPGTEAAYYRARCGDALVRPGDPRCDATLAPPPDLFPNAKVRGGYDLIGDRWPNPDPACGVNQVCLREDVNPIDTSGHGTAVADILAGLPLTPGGNDTGVAPGADLWIFKACNGGAGLCSGTAVLLAIDHAMDLDGSDRGRCSPEAGAVCATYDPADIIVVPVSFRYGQPEDALSFFAEVAGFYGSLVVAAAGNEGDKPYIVGAPGVASAAIAVAESGFPVRDPYTLRTDAQNLDARLQSWSALETDFSGDLRYGNGDGTNTTGCLPLTPVTGALLIDRDGCPPPVKVRNAQAAGAALVLIADTAGGAAPPALPGTAADLPVFSLTRAEADALKADLADATVQVQLEVAHPDRDEQIIAGSSRGPRIADGAIKPDLAAPGAIVAALAGSGVGTGPFSGSSGSAPVVAGVAALVVQELERRNIIDPAPGLRDQVSASLSLAPLIKAVVVNNADPTVLRGADGLPAPFTAQGSGRVDARAAYDGRVIALDVTAINTLLAATPTPAGCAIQPYIDLLRFLFLQRPLPCAVEYPFGNDLLRAWNGQAPSVSFGYRAASGYQEYTRQIALMNYSLSEHSYELSTSFRNPANADRGVAVTVDPPKVTIPAGDVTVITVTLALSPSAMREGALTNARADGSCASDQEGRCDDLTAFEVDGLVHITGTNERQQITIPWQVLPRRAAAVAVAGNQPGQVTLRNPAVATDGRVETFALIDISPNQCDQRNVTTCESVDYVPGIFPGSNESPLDLHLIGVRGGSCPDLNTQFGLPADAPGVTPDEVIEFALTVHDRPFRAVPGVPARFAISIDANRDGAMDYLVYNADVAGGADGRSAVFVRDINPLDGVAPERWYFLVDADFNTQRWILPVPAAAVGVRSNQPFDFTVQAFDGSFGGAAWDCSPGAAGVCTGVHTFQTGSPAYVPDQSTLTVPAHGQATVTYTTSPGGSTASASQIGLMFVFRDAVPGQEAASVRLR